ncbi:exodeoxyribonuclease VII large subunit [Erwinia pyrifoliae]|uniref:Exodeoxyribonuclease 7 large subunit n=1 Tax=Erwinia pyrifoliae TaxID=79967 RepID=A0ABY5XAT7_ERWPY|nr:exodeoxyribonuclease VII large subunit [Erwinia pyrifoliae]AUX73392.1 exodeoxyribonuclease VII large subunit [Erwinia pyrifoliae]MCA8876311.1 exodeoxyribonuclease VII large subunit [Erwinia pyrifoliae]MCT2386451.1 exodeoxyribonuclease VII large subunit [Erwinia pyrifoliae]MCU8587952.1 exodeoxyribonuclease VII large subunit [Erwinia pyrifoliae]UWS28357.1 exodeoxyribonuclease VII large subunit [Erwinia pyrifoliae]
MSQPPGSNIFTVSRLNSTVRKLLEMEMGQVWLSAEISNFSQPSSGHWYFTLKDDTAQVRCAMFRNGNRRVTFRPQNGQQVLVRATITLYEPRGDYQLIAESMQPAGDGLLQQQFEQLKQRLMTEGLFEQAHKQPLPDPARQVGVITSSSGAALHDVLRVLQRRDPSLPVVIYPTPVQGAEAPPGIVRAIELANARNECDVLIVGRGGGSLEDLWSFNDERVARAIFASRIPIVSAVGHETDVTIADFVADLRAPTPSAAAELVSRNQIERLRQLQSQQQRMEMAMDYYLAQQQRTFTRLQHRLQQQHPQLRLARQQTALMILQRRLDDALQQQLRRAARRQEILGQRLNAFRPEIRIERASQQLQQWQYRLQQAMQQQLGTGKQHFGQLAARLEGVSPLATLARGFSVTSNADGQVIKKTRQLHRGDTLKTRLDDGWVESEVTVITPLKKTRGRSV